MRGGRAKNRCGPGNGAPVGNSLAISGKTGCHAGLGSWNGEMPVLPGPAEKGRLFLESARLRPLPGKPPLGVKRRPSRSFKRPNAHPDASTLEPRKPATARDPALHWIRRIRVGIPEADIGAITLWRPAPSAWRAGDRGRSDSGTRSHASASRDAAVEVSAFASDSRPARAPYRNSIAASSSQRPR
jgi:hypothetical protein